MSDLLMLVGVLGLAAVFRVAAAVGRALVILVLLVVGFAALIATGGDADASPDGSRGSVVYHSGR